MKSYRHEAAGGVLHQKLTTLLYQSLLRLRVLGEGGPQRLLGQDEQVRVAHAADVCRASVSVLVSCSAQQTDRQTRALMEKQVAAVRHTQTHPFNGPLSGTTRVSRYQNGKTDLDFTEAIDSEWQWHQLGHMQVCTSLLE